MALLRNQKKVIDTPVQNFWQVKEEPGDSFYVQNNQNWTCTCGKLTSSGLPCSHLMRILNDKGILIETLQNIIAQTWIISNEKLELSLIDKSDELNAVEFEVPEHSTTLKERYLELKSKSKTISELACKNDANYKGIMEAFETIEKKLLGMIIDVTGVQSGRPRKSRLKY
mgnify:CR=1 FL=1